MESKSIKEAEDHNEFRKSLEGKPYGVQKVMLMKKLGHKWDKAAVIAG